MSIEGGFSEARTFEQAFDLLADEARALGFDAVDYGFMPAVRTADGVWNAPEIRSRNFPRRWSVGWRRYSSQDPYLWSLYERNLPLDWREVKDACWLTDIQHEAIAYIEGLGFHDGISVPIHLSGSRFAFVSGLSHAPRGSWRDASSAAAQQLFMLAHTFHAAAVRHLRPRADRAGAALSRRETEVLRHAAAGLSAPATAHVMHRSVETVRRQRKSAMARLGAHTIAQAVARAMSLGLIE